MASSGSLVEWRRAKGGRPPARDVEEVFASGYDRGEDE
jgi:hypothetical protein